jgi:hypothetical protein
MRPMSAEASATHVYAEDLGSDEFFELNFGENGVAEGNEEIGADFDFSVYDKALRLRRKALELLGINPYM